MDTTPANTQDTKEETPHTKQRILGTIMHIILL